MMLMVSGSARGHHLARSSLKREQNVKSLKRVTLPV